MVAEIYDVMENMFLGRQADEYIFAVEVPGGSQDARAASCLGMARGIIGATMNFISYYIDCITFVTPQEVHKKAVGKTKATKDEIIDYIVNKWSLDWEKKGRSYNYTVQFLEKGINQTYTKGKFEHVADSLVINELGLDDWLKSRRKK